MSLVINSFSIKEVQEVYMDLEIAGNYKDIGFNPAGDALHFGLVPLLGRSNRNFTISHEYAYPIKVSIRSVGNITPFLIISDNDFILEPNIFKKLRATVIIPKDSEAGNYDGTLKIIFKKPLIN